MDSTPVSTRINTAGEDVMLELVADLLQRTDHLERRYVGAPASASLIGVEALIDLPPTPESDYAYVAETDQVYTNTLGAWVIGGTPPGW